MINSLKHALNADTKDGQITVSYEVSGTDWKLSVADNGVGKPDGVFAQPKSGLGTGIVKALAKQLDSQVVTLSGPKERPSRLLTLPSQAERRKTKWWRSCVLCLGSTRTQNGLNDHRQVMSLLGA